MLLTLALDETRTRAHLCPYINAEQLISRDIAHFSNRPGSAPLCGAVLVHAGLCRTTPQPSRSGMYFRLSSIGLLSPTWLPSGSMTIA